MADTREGRPKKDRMPWAFAIGVAVTALGLFQLLVEGMEVGFLVVLIGVVLIGVGLVQRSIERRGTDSTRI